MKKLLFYLLLLLILVSCNKEKGRVIAKVDDDILTLKRLKAQFTESEWNDLSQDRRKQYVYDWINLTLLAGEADRLKISETDEVQIKIESAAKNIKSNALLANKLANLSVTEDEMFNYYKLHKSKFQRKVKKYKIQRILIKDKSKLDFIRQQLSNIRFSRIARKYSKEAIGKNGGYVGYVMEDEINSKIWNEVTKLDKNHYKTIEVDNNYYLTRWVDKKDDYVDKNFLTVKDEVKDMVLKKKKDELFENLLEEIRNKSDIEIAY